MLRWLARPWLLLAVVLCIVASGIVAVACRSTESSLAAQIDNFAATCFPPEKPGAAILVKVKYDILFSNGYGLANVEWTVSITPQTAFRLGSITKQFTAMGILLLVADGKVSLNDPIDKYFSVFQGRGIGVENLLTHTSGLKSFTSLAGYRVLRHLNPTRREMLALIAAQPPDFSPGTEWAYSDSGYYVLGLLIEKVSGKSYEEFLKTRLFRPLGMNSTVLESEGRIVPRQASGYAVLGGQLVNAPFLDMEVPFAAGALVSTTEDLAKWDNAIHGKTMVRSDLLKAMFDSAKLSDGRDTHYGFGWFT